MTKTFCYGNSVLDVYENGRANIWTNNWAAGWSINDAIKVIDMYKDSIKNEKDDYFSEDELNILSAVYLWGIFPAIRIPRTEWAVKQLIKKQFFT